jgi:hypothetical protein
MLSNVENDPDNGQRNDHTLSAFWHKADFRPRLRDVR